jgi:hypothetical protein
MVPRLREYRVVPMREHRKVRLIQASFYALCFLVGIASGLIAARMLGTHSAPGQSEHPVVTIKTLG